MLLLLPAGLHGGVEPQMEFVESSPVSGAVQPGAGLSPAPEGASR